MGDYSDKICVLLFDSLRYHIKFVKANGGWEVFGFDSAPGEVHVGATEVLRDLPGEKIFERPDLGRLVVLQSFVVAY